jgi:hypothetical protein
MRRTIAIFEEGFGMRFRDSLLLALLCLPTWGITPGTYSAQGPSAASWAKILDAVGILAAPPSQAQVVVTDTISVDTARSRVEQGAILVLEGASPAAQAFGFQPTEKRVEVHSALDARQPKIPLIWETPADVPVFATPPGATVFVKERWQGAPLVAGLRRGAGAVLWLALSPGTQGYERFPYLPQALCDLGLVPTLESRRLWAFFDSSYRLRVDVDYFAARWRQAGIAALHVAAWHYMEADPARDRWLAQLIEACHRNAIQVYAWLEPPHISEAFWRAHPEWREKTAIGQDAHLDWRKLMNLANPECAAAAKALAAGLIERFDWDGVNLAELYFESPEGYRNAARFTPFNDDVRSAFRKAHGFDPAELWEPSSPRYHERTAEPMRLFLDDRANLAHTLQLDWIGHLEKIRRAKPQLDVVLTHVDDRFDSTMRDTIGADAARLLPVTESKGITFLVEDPATVWHLGPQRYPEIAKRYAPIAKRPEQLAIDINIAERYQNVYPTKQQTGTELFQLVNLGARAFQRVAVYFESSISNADVRLLPAATATVTRAAWTQDRYEIDSPRGVGIRWAGSAQVNGQLWPAQDGDTLWLPAGKFAIERAAAALPVQLLDLNASMLAASVAGRALSFDYESRGRGYAVVNRLPAEITLDGHRTELVVRTNEGRFTIAVPPGKHTVRVTVSGDNTQKTDAP